MTHIHKELFDKTLIDKDQFAFFEAIETKKVVSVYYELRIVLYLGIMLFTGGVGYIAYENMSDLGHLLVMMLLLLSIGLASYYVFQKSLPYSNGVQVVEHIYFDYVLILNALLIVSLFTYVQVYFDLLPLLLSYTTYITTALFLYLAYRYDSKAMLSMGIAAFVSAFGLTITPINWSQSLWMPENELFLTAVIIGLFLFGAGLASIKLDVKKHFSFTYSNFGVLLYYFGLMFFLFGNDYEILAACVMCVTAALAAYYFWIQKEFVLFLYSGLAAYIAMSYLLARLLLLGNENGIELLFYYFPISSISSVVMLVKNKNHFAND